MRRFVCILSCLLCSMAVICAHRVTYTADESSIFRNPERGFTEELGGETMLTDAKPYVVQPEADDFFKQKGDRETQTLVVLMYYLGNYKTKDLSEALLQAFDEDMAILRTKGFKCVLRFAYDWKSKTDASLTYVKKHIASLKPYLVKNADVIYVLETGFVGQWGEWYYSSNFGNETQHLNDNRRQVLTAMLDACPPDRFLLVRYPLIKTEYLGDEVALTADSAFSGSARARIGHHNDAFLNKYGNDGTYGRDGDGPEDDPVLRQYIATETLYVPNGGETNVESSSTAKKVYAQAETEMSTYHWSFCGSTYAEQVTNRWRNDGIYDRLNRKMGYRYELVSADLPERVEQGAGAAIELRIRNVGYAPLYNARTAYIVFANQQSHLRIPLQTDPRRWLPNGETAVINETIMLPDDMPVGTYSLHLYMPDAYASIADDPRYAIRFANVGTWDAETGMNSLNASIQVTDSTTDLEVIRPRMTEIRGQKILKDGQLLIRKDGAYYTIVGGKVQGE